MSDPSRDDRVLDLARRLLSGEAIDWDKEGVAEAEVREGMQRLQQVIGRRDDMTELFLHHMHHPPPQNSAQPHDKT